MCWNGKERNLLPMRQLFTRETRNVNEQLNEGDGEQGPIL